MHVMKGLNSIYGVDLGGENALLQNACIEGENGIWRLVWVEVGH